MQEFKLDIDPIHQYDNNLPTGCEACAAFMLLRWMKVEKSLQEVISALIKVTIPTRISDTEWIGGDPNKGFVGDPYDANSFGAFHGPIFKLIDHFTNRAQDLTGSDFEQILNHMQKEKKPVVCWVTLELKEPRITDTWFDVEDRNNVIQWSSPEHCLLLVGFTENQVIVNDPHTGRVDYHEKSLFEKRYIQLGKQAVSIK